MPGSNHGPSIKNPRVYDALRRRGMSKRRAAMISNAQRHKDSGTANLAIPPHGTDALFNQPAMAQRRRRKRYKALNWGAHVGQTIGGRLRRGGGGRFEGDGTPQAPPASRERRAALREARQRRMDDIKGAREAERKVEDAKRAEEDAYIAAGKTGRERQQRRAAIAQARRDRAAERKAVHQRELEQERETRRKEDEDEKGKQEADKKKGGGGGGGKKKPSEDEKQVEQERKRAANRAAAAPKAGLAPDEAEYLKALAEGTASGAFDTKRLAALGLVADGEATDAGRRLLAALERGDVRGALAAIQDGKAKLVRDRARADAKRQRDADKKKRDAERAKRDAERKRQAAERKKPPVPAPKPAPDAAARRERSGKLAAQIIRNLSERRQRRRTKAQATFGGQKRSDLSDSVFAGPDRSFPIKTAQDVRDAVRSLGRTKHDKAAVRRGIIRRARAIGAVDALPESWRTEKAASVFAVFKDAAGRDRWAAITTTAYQDKDGEWIGTKAIRGVVAAGDAGAPRGPLCFWHVQGLALGDCDYQATAYDDRFLIESGTFRTPAAARIGAKAAARGYQMSPGFLHTHREPRDGLYEHIALFERSFVPPGRAANPYTRLLTKGDRMLTDEKKKEFEALAGDAEGRALLEGLLAQAATTVKANDDAGAVYKDAPAWAQALVARLDGMEERLKAMPPMAVAAADEQAAAADDDLAALETETTDDGMGMDDEGFADMLVQKLMAALGPMLDLEKKVAGYLDSMKGMLQPMQQKDDTRAKQLGDLDARLKELEGTQPRARTSLAGDVWGQLSGIPVTKEQAGTLTAQTPAGGTMPPNLTPQEQGAWNLIYGNGGTPQS